MSDAGIWLAAIGTLAIFSFLYRDNPAYRAAEQILVGLSVGYLVVVTVRTTLVPKVALPILDGDPWGIVAAVWVLLMWTRVSTRAGWLSRLPLAVIVGAGAGLSIPAMLKARVLSQLGAVIRPEIDVNAVVGAIGVLATLSYFYTIMSRLSLLIGRTEFLLGDWLGLL